MARTNGRRFGGSSARRAAAWRRAAPGSQRELISVIADLAQEVSRVIQRPPTRPDLRTKFQTVALLAREERTRVLADKELAAPKRAKKLERLDGIALMLARTAARDASLLRLLDDDATVSSSAYALKARLMREAGLEPPEPPPAPAPAPAPSVPADLNQVLPKSVAARQLANPFLAPDVEANAARNAQQARRLAGWELLEPLLRAFEQSTADSPSCMPLPPPGSVRTPAGRTLMPHQAQVVAAAASGHRSFLLADEPGLGKTAQALLAAQAADAYPLLVVSPNVVKPNWAREAELWTPQRRATVVHGDGDQVDGFADIVIVNYELLGRHFGWLTTFGFRGMVVDEAHFIKNKRSKRSQQILEISSRIRSRNSQALLMALTGTPLINDIEDFLAIWQFLDWIDDEKPRGPLMAALEAKGLVPSDAGFYTSARETVIDMGIVRRRKIDVVADIPARRVLDVPVELDGAEGRSIRAAEAALAARLVDRYRAALVARPADDTEATEDAIDHKIVRRVAATELKATRAEKEGENVFTMVRRIGQAKAALAADYTAQLAHNVGKVVFFAKHIDVMDQAEQTFADRGIRCASIRGDQTAKARAQAIEAFTEDPEVAVVVCSLMAAGVGLNLQVASNLVLAELSWTAAEQTQAIDRIHRIGQDEPVTAWRVLAARTIDSKIAALIDSKSGLAARALDGAGEDDGPDAADVQLEALIGLLTDALADGAA